MDIPQMEKGNKLEPMKKLAAQYVPEWNYDEQDPDSGVVLCKVLDKMFQDTLRCFNRTLYNYYIKFLNLLGAKVAHSVSAKGMITVEPTKGSGGIYVKKGTLLYATAADGDGRVFFETVDGMFAVDTELDSIFFTDSVTDTIINVYNQSKPLGLNMDEDFRLFYNDASKNIQSHEVYFKSDILLLTKDETNISIAFSDKKSLSNNNQLSEVFSGSNVKWQYYKDENWHDISSVKAEDNEVKIHFKNNSDVYSFMGFESMFLRCLFNKIPDKSISFTNAHIAASADEILPDAMVCNLSELSLSDCFPFGDEYAPFTGFYIASEEAFTKKGAKIDIKVEMQFLNVKVEHTVTDKIKYRNIMHRSDFEAPEPTSTRILRVTWEYWNGLGWSKLYKDDENEDFFEAEDENTHEKILSFICPDDMEKVNVGAFNSYFIRARIVKMKNPYNLSGVFITPYLHSTKIGYNYNDNYILCEDLFVKSDLEEKRFNFKDTKENQTILKNMLNEYPTVYFCLTSPLEQGPVRILFDIEETLKDKYPSVQWEYYSESDRGIKEWQYIRISDETENFKHSGIVTLMGRKNFSKTKLFGKEGYYLRLVNNDSEYREKSKKVEFPKINGIYGNTVSVIQRESYGPEYFSIEKIEENKVCRLAHKNIIKANVWVNELGTLSTEEENYLISHSDDDNVITERNDKGKICALWVKWHEKSSVKSASMEERAYEVDNSKGYIIFGDGRYGKIPSHQESYSIMIKYSVSQGAKGNIGAEKISGFSDAVPYVAKVKNIKSMTGGMEQEIIDETADRMACELSCMGRIISADDFEYAICKFNRNIYKIKCAHHINRFGEPSPGAISLAILPRQFMQGHEKFSILRDDVKKLINEKAPATMVASNKIDIFEALYVEIIISLDLIIDDYNYCQEVQQEINNKLERFLNPVSGNFNGKGWDIGRIATREQIYNCIKSINHIRWIKQTNLFTKLITEHGKKEVDFDYIKENPFIIPVCGETNINMNVDVNDDNLYIRR